jgi:hypothetical protein
MNKCAVLACGLALATLSSTPMFADTVFDFSFTGNNTAYGSPGNEFDGSGQFVTQATGTAGEYQIVGISGTVDGSAITSLVAQNGHYDNDNLLYYTNGAASASIDADGISFVLASNEYGYFFLDTSLSPAGDRELLFLTGEDAAISITPASSPSAVPEPGSLALLGTGVLGLLGTLRRRLAV